MTALSLHNDIVNARESASRAVLATKLMVKVDLLLGGTSISS